LKIKEKIPKPNNLSVLDACVYCGTENVTEMYCVVRGTLEIRKMPCKRASLSIGALLGNLEGVR